MTFGEVFASIGTFLGNTTSSIISGIVKWIAYYGLNLTDFQAKLLSLAVVFSVMTVVVYAISSTKKFIKWGLFAILLILFISVGFSLFE